MYSSFPWSNSKEIWTACSIVMGSKSPPYAGEIQLYCRLFGTCGRVGGEKACVEILQQSLETIRVSTQISYIYMMNLFQFDRRYGTLLAKDYHSTVHPSVAHGKRLWMTRLSPSLWLQKIMQSQIAPQNSDEPKLNDFVCTQCPRSHGRA